MGKIVVIGSSNTDMVVTSKKMPLPGETVMGNDFSIIPGGKGANQAVAIARAGGDIEFIAKVGNDDFGTQAIEGYKMDGINTNAIQRDNTHPTGIALIIVDETTGQNSIVVAPGANAQLSTNDIKDLEETIAGANILLVQLEIPLESVKEALKIAKKNHIITILNPAPASKLGDEILKLVDIITPNETETELITGIKIHDEESIRKAGTVLLEKVNDCVLITLGSKGVYYKSKMGEEQFVPATKVDAVDTTAAGDVFNGYFAAALALGKDYKAAIIQANKAAAISVTRKGAQTSIPRAEETGFPG